MCKRRTEAFSDGVFSIAITLLILEIKVPPFIGQSNQELAWALFSLWPSFFAFVGSFATILVLWINHHGLFTLAEHATPKCLFANGFLPLFSYFSPVSDRSTCSALDWSGSEYGGSRLLRYLCAYQPFLPSFNFSCRVIPINP